MDLNPALHTFMAESAELLAQMEQALLGLDPAAVDREALDAIFRAAHTIKGSAGIFGFDDLVAFTHHVESLLDRLRTGELSMNPALSQLLLHCADHIGRLVAAIDPDSTPDPDLVAGGEKLRRALGAFEEAPQPAVTTAGNDRTADPRPLEGGWRISLGFGPEVLRNGMDPLSFLRYLSTLGTLRNVTTLSARLPALADLDPEACYLDFALELVTPAPHDTVMAAFEFVRDDCRVDLVPLTDAASLPVEDAAPAPEALAGAPPQAGQSADAPSPAARQPEPTPATEGSARRGSDARSALDTRLIRVDADRLDQLINLVGELVTAGAATQALAQRARQAELAESAATMGSLVAEVRDCALGLRMVQIGATFQRFQRVVHDVSRDLGKSIDLLITGGDTELDKSVVEKIADPLMHLVRNAMDHGIETPDVRAAVGKPAVASLTLNAFHDSGSIVIEVADDGAGLNRERILTKAIERGLIAPSATPSDREILQLIFEPGFSTADTVSNLSGRGVGMDVVRRNIEQVRGSIELDSQPGAGTTVRIRLPLTLAIIDGFLVGIDAARFVVPLEGVVECAALQESDREAVAARGFLNLRGEALPVVRLRDVFGLEAIGAGRENIVVVRGGGTKAGLVVDDLLGEFQTVIKPLGRLFTHLKGVSGATLLGSGEIALILDVPGLIQRHTRAPDAQTPALCA